MTEPLFAVTVIGFDRPGIVSAVTEVLYELGCNLEDVTSTILRGQFTMTMIVRGGESTEQAIQDALEAVCSPLDLLVSARSLPPAPAAVPSPDHIVSVYGADRPGILYRVARVLADRGCNITDLTTRIIGSADEPVYAVMLEVALSDPEGITEELEGISAELGLDVTVHPLEVELL